MARTKMELIDVTLQEHYSSIIELTHNFQNPEKRGKDNQDMEEGLRAMHYIYALQNGGKDSISFYNQARARNFYGDKLDRLFKLNDEYEKHGLIRYIYPDYIKPGTTIHFFLKKLVKDYEILEKIKDSEGKNRYIISKKYRGEYIRQRVKVNIDRYDPETIDAMQIPYDYTDEELIKELRPYIEIETWIKQNLFGFPPDLYKSCSKQDKELIKRALDNIRTFTALLYSIKYRKTGDKKPIGIYVSAMKELRY